MDPPYRVALDPEHARQLASTGASLLLLGVPQGTLLGIDQQVFVVGPKFQGLKMVPPGVHFVSYQPPPREGRVTPAVSTFLDLAPRAVVVRRWDAAAEGLTPLADEDEAERYAAGVRRFDFDTGLAPYDLAACSRWRDLSCFISADVLARLMPVGGEISVMAEALDPELMTPRTPAERALVQQLQDGHARQQQRSDAAASAGMEADAPACAEHEASAAARDGTASAGSSDPEGGRAQTRWGRCFYTRLPRAVHAPGAEGAALTALNLDKTAALEQALAALGDPGGKQLLGELQFAYIAFLYGQSLEGFLQWKALVCLMLGCERGPLRSHSGMFTAFLATVQQQLDMGLGQQRQQQRRRRGGGAGTDQADRGGGSSSGGDGSDSGSEGNGGAGGACPLGTPLVEELLPDSFLRRAFRAFFALLHESGAEVPPAVAKQASRLEMLLRARLGWDYRVAALGGDCGNSEDEDAPVVVELTEEQQQLAGLCFT